MSESERSGPGKGCAVFGCGALLLLVVLIVVVLLFLAQRGPGAGGPTMLVLDLRTPLPERADPDFGALLGERSIDLIGLRQALLTAAQESDVAGVLVKISAGGMQPGRAEELWRLLRAFREDGKLVMAHLDGVDTLGYLVATAADELLLEQSSWLNASGLQMRAFFLKDALARFGLEADFVRVGAYKGAVEQFAASEPSPEFDVAMNALADSLWGSVLSLISQARGLEREALAQAFNRAPLLPDEALEARLVDRLVWRDELRTVIEARVGEAVDYMSVREFLRRRRTPSSEKVFGVVHVTGMITEGTAQPTLLGGPVAAAETIVRALEKAAAAEDVAGIVVRIDSGGGSVSASEKIWRAVEQAAKQKPVVASMGGAAASGGYYAACAADRIFAERMTLTGSIGIFGGKLVLGNLLRDQEVGSREYARGENAGLFDMTRPFSVGERRTLQGLLESAYRSFVKRVADGRERSFAEIDGVAQGRVWTGQAAVGVGLVDEIGGLSVAVEGLRGLATLEAEEPVGLRLYPEPADWIDLVFPAQDETTVSALATALGRERSGVAPLLEQVRDELRRAGLFAEAEGLALMPVALEAR